MASSQKSACAALATHCSGISASKTYNTSLWIRISIAGRVYQRPALPRNASHRVAAEGIHSTVTDFARFLGLSTSLPRSSAAW